MFSSESSTVQSASLIMNLKLLVIIKILNLLTTPSLSARILAIIPTPSYSHQIVFQPLWRELSLKGHQVTVLTTNPLNDSSLKNLTEIDLHQLYVIYDKINMNEMAKLTTLQMLELIVEFGGDLLEKLMKHAEVQALIKNETQRFDLVMAEALWPLASAFSVRFKCPLIQVMSMEARAHVYNSMGNPTHPVLYPDLILPFAGELTFMERVLSTLYAIFIHYLQDMRLVASDDLLVKKYFGENYPYLQDILNNVSLLFVNTDPILHDVRPMLPNIVQIGGGTHIKPPQPLPKELQRVLDDASQGFIYFSLGSNVKSKFLSESTRQVLLETFAELPYKVLWKFEEENLPGKPENVIISKWFPQQDIFRHPNIKLFISQGGLQSIEEAVYNHIPIVGMPFAGDQPANVRKIVYKGFGLLVEHTTMDKTSLKNVILEVISNPKYRNKVKELAELAKDQPTTGLERAIWWTEYVLRHKGARHLRSPAADLPCYQYFLLDVIGFCFLVFFVVIYVLMKLIKLILKRINYFKSKPKVKIP